MRNKYIKRSHISDSKFRMVLRYFCKDLDATMTASLVGISRQSVNRLYGLFRARILELCSLENKMSGEVEIDESYFGPHRVRGKRGRGAGQKTPVIGLLKRSGKVYTQVIDSVHMRELIPVIRGKVLKGSDVYTDGFRSYDGLLSYGYKHHRIHHHNNEFARGFNHINGVESFWSYAKRRLRKFNGIRRSKFILHIKESEFRWNHRGDKMYERLIKNFRNSPL